MSMPAWLKRTSSERPVGPQIPSGPLRRHLDAAVGHKLLFDLDPRSSPFRVLSHRKACRITGAHALRPLCPAFPGAEIATAHPPPQTLAARLQLSAAVEPGAGGLAIGVGIGRETVIARACSGLDGARGAALVAAAPAERKNRNAAPGQGEAKAGLREMASRFGAHASGRRGWAGFDTEGQNAVPMKRAKEIRRESQRESAGPLFCREAGSPLRAGIRFCVDRGFERVQSGEKGLLRSCSVRHVSQKGITPTAPLILPVCLPSRCGKTSRQGIARPGSAGNEFSFSMFA